jgi:hypothetical protein
MGVDGSNLLRLTNSGNTSDVSRIHLTDVLPIIGDRGVLLSTQERGTGWDPRPTLLGQPTGSNAGTLSHEYTESDTVGQSICLDVMGANNPPPVPSGCAPATWSPDFVPAATAFRSQLDFGRTNPLRPGQTALIRFDVASPVALTEPESYAWNSFAYQVESYALRAPADAQPRYGAPTEPIQAGIGLLYGALEVTKRVVNPLDGVDLGPFPVEYRCTTEQVTTAGSQQVPVAGGTLQIEGGQTVRVPGQLPAGARCRVWETDSLGAESSNLGEANAVTVTITTGTAADGTAKPPQNVTITNTYPQGFLQLTKALAGDGVAFVANDTPFVFDVSCTYSGQPVSGFNPRTKKPLPSCVPPSMIRSAALLGIPESWYSSDTLSPSSHTGGS